MYNDVVEARYTSEQQDNILVLYNTDEDGVIEECIEVGSIQHKQLTEAGWDKDKIIDFTANFKRQQVRAVRENLKIAARDVYEVELNYIKRELAILRKQLLEAQILTKQRKEEALKRLTYLNKLEADFSDKVKSMNTFMSKTIPTDDVNYTLNNIIEFFKVFNTNEEALNIVQNKSDKTKNSKSLLAALKHLI
jgi:6-phosphogluconate dehydrogenase